MEEVKTLREYIWDKHGVDIRNPAPSEEVSVSSTLTSDNVSLKDELILPPNFIPNFVNLLKDCQQDFQSKLYAALDAIASELIELEDHYEVALRNPAVTESGEKARIQWNRARELWKRNRNYAGDNAAQRAINHSLDSLIAAYQHTAAHKIVRARKYIEDIEWLVSPKTLISIHGEARSFYDLGRSAQRRQNHDQSRKDFKTAILLVGQFYLEAESSNHLMDMNPNQPT
ncbi:MAG: hypothetical protein AAF564_04315 [Bacteroidota bacterium]